MFPNAAVNKSNGEIFEGGSCKTMVFYSSSRVPPPKKKSIVDPFLTFLVLMRVGTIINQKFLAEIFLGVGGG